MSEDYFSDPDPLEGFALASFSGAVMVQATVVNVEEYLTAKHGRTKSVFTDRIMKGYFKGVQNYIEAHLPKTGDVARLGLTFKAVSIQHEYEGTVQIVTHEDLDTLSDYRILDEDMHFGFIPKQDERFYAIAEGQEVTAELGWILETLPPNPPTPIVKNILGHRFGG